MRILITGASGNLGRRVVSELQADHELLLTGSSAPDEATVFDAEAPGFRRLAPLQTEWPYLQAHLRETDAISDFARDAEVVIHLAASLTGDWADVEKSFDANVLGTTSMLEVVRRTGARRLVNASSINAFGTFFFRVSDVDPVLRALPLDESEEPVPEDPYSLTKYLSEEVGKAYWRAFGVEVVNLRLAGVWPESRYARALDTGLPSTVEFPKDLGQWVHIDDVAAAFALSVTAPGVSPQPMTIGAADTKLPEPTLELVRRYRPDLVPYVSAPMPGRSAMLSIARARTNLGYSPRFRLDDAVRT